MATTAVVLCECGQSLSVYLPKATLARWLGESGTRLDDAHAIDRMERDAGEIEDARLFARICGTQWVDGSDRCRCESCGASVDPENDLRFGFIGRSRGGE
jgi:hypothetical protein